MAFGKRVTPPTGGDAMPVAPAPAAAAQQAAASSPQSSRPWSRPNPMPAPAPPRKDGLTTVIVPRSSADAAKAGDPYLLLQSIADYVNSLIEGALYIRDELPPRALMAYYADYYLNQMKNSGHGRFYQNVGAHREYVLPTISEALADMGADKHAAIFATFLSRIRRHEAHNGDVSGAQGDLSDQMDDLDTQLYQLEDQEPLSQLSAAWILSWPELKALDDAECGEAMRHVARMNPKRQPRQEHRSLAAIDAQLTDDLAVRIGMACAAADEIKLEIGGGRDQLIDGVRKIVFEVRTDQDWRFAALEDDGGLSLYVRVEGGDPRFAGKGGTLYAEPDNLSFRDVLGPHAGQRLGHVDGATVKLFAERAEEYSFAPAIMLGLRGLGVDVDDVNVTPMEADIQEHGVLLRCFVISGESGWNAYATPTQTILMCKEEVVGDISTGDAYCYQQKVMAAV